MKNKIPIILLFSLMIPNLAFAAWWNPITWFVRENPDQLEELEAENSVETPDAANPDTENVSLPTRPEDLQSELQTARKEIQEMNTEISSLKKALAVLQKNLASANPQCKPAIVEKIVYQDRIVERPVEKIVYRDRVVQASCNTPTTSTQTSNTKQAEPIISTPKTYQELHCPKIVRVEDSLGNIGETSVSGVFQKGDIDSIVISVTAIDPQGLPLYFAFLPDINLAPGPIFGGGDWIENATTENSATIFVTEANVGANRHMWVRVWNQDDYSCIGANYDTQAYFNYDVTL